MLEFTPFRCRLVNQKIFEHLQGIGLVWLFPMIRGTCWSEHLVSVFGTPCFLFVSTSVTSVPRQQTRLPKCRQASSCTWEKIPVEKMESLRSGPSLRISLSTECMGSLKNHLRSDFKMGEAINVRGTPKEGDEETTK